MDKKTFYDELSARLRELGVRNDYIDRHITQFENYFADKSAEQVEAEIDSLGDIDRVASRIKRVTDKMLLTDTGIPSEERQTSSGTKTSDAQQTAKEDAENDGRNDASDDGGDDDAAREVRQLRSLKGGGAELPSDGLFDSGDGEDSTEDDGDGGDDERITSRVKKTSYDDAEIKKRLTFFRIVSIICIPLVIFILLVTALAFAAVFLAISLLVIAAVAALAVTTVCGTCVFVFGLILGVVKLLETLPAGLYECGLSVMAGAAALFCGILLYNFAVRLMPWAASKLLHFMKFVFRKYRVFYAYIKKEVLKL